MLQSSRRDFHPRNKYLHILRLHYVSASKYEGSNVIEETHLVIQTQSFKCNGGNDQ